MATVGIGDDIKPITTIENLYSIVVVILGVGIVAFIIGNITSLFNSLQSVESERHARLHKIGNYLDEVDVPATLKQRILGYYEYVT